MNKKEIQLILQKLSIKPKKSLSQNLLIDKNILNVILSESEISKDDIILEVGSGLGVLTEKIVKKAKKVYAVEIDSRFYSYLANKFSTFNNIEIINKDILKMDIPSHDKCVSNVPYSITGPLIEKIFFKSKPPQGILMIEKSIADRIFFDGTYKNFSRITVSLNSFMKPIRKREISRNCFYPIPNIDISLIKIVPKENINPFLLENEKKVFFLKFVAGVMPYKNKNIINAVNLFLKSYKKLNFKKENIIKILQENNIANNKLSSLKINDFIELSRLFYNF
ncbi:MAG: 16S rRNA (adenine(1518)-N(6)/adenine(1519)-N(6))-dimethyltransferase RsmA [Promethearchaeota archaeon]